jgi:ABC-type lipoprotein release transport system permease subunit
VSQSLRLALAGVVIGTIGALFGARWIEPLLFRQSSRDPTVLALVCVTLLAVAIAASVMPAWRASRMDPKSVLQSD